MLRAQQVGSLALLELLKQTCPPGEPVFGGVRTDHATTLDKLLLLLRTASIPVM